MGRGGCNNDTDLFHVNPTGPMGHIPPPHSMDPAQVLTDAVYFTDCHGVVRLVLQVEYSLVLEGVTSAPTEDGGTATLGRGDVGESCVYRQRVRGNSDIAHDVSCGWGTKLD